MILFIYIFEHCLNSTILYKKYVMKVSESNVSDLTCVSGVESAGFGCRRIFDETCME